MEPNLDHLRFVYKKAADEWIEAIRDEEALATADHSMVALERLDEAHFREEDAHARYTKALEAYKDGLRRVNYGI